MRNFIQGQLIKYYNAKTVIKQIRLGEWKPVYNELCLESLNAHRVGFELWLGNGAWFCDIEEIGRYGLAGVKVNAFGLIFRHWVWWAAARKLKLDADLKCAYVCGGKK